MGDEPVDLELLYVTDPMCSWCWGFAPVIADLQLRLGDTVPIRFVMGGLAPDSDEPMDAETMAMVQGAWRAVAARTGATFNHDFWSECIPRRSTWPACRAVLAAEAMGPGLAASMFAGIQRAYYLEARNPSDEATLVGVAEALGLESGEFVKALRSPGILAGLRRDFDLKESLGVRGFPALALRSGREVTVLCRGWIPPAEVDSLLAGVGLR